jgi:hypothetical protein
MEVTELAFAGIFSNGSPGAFVSVWQDKKRVEQRKTGITRKGNHFITIIFSFLVNNSKALGCFPTGDLDEAVYFFDLFHPSRTNF